MDERLKEQVDVCDDFSPFFEEESMPESIVHAELIWYLVAVLKWLFRDSLCAICENFAFLPPLEQPGPSVAPILPSSKAWLCVQSSRAGASRLRDQLPMSCWRFCRPRPGKRIWRRNPTSMPAWVSTNILPTTLLLPLWPPPPAGGSLAGNATRSGGA